MDTESSLPPNVSPRGSAGSGIHRRAVTRAAAWSAPVVAVATAAPAKAATTCVDTRTGRIDWGAGYTRSNVNSGSGTAQMDLGANDITYTISTVEGPRLAPSSTQLTAPEVVNGESVLRLFPVLGGAVGASPAADIAGFTQTTTITFSQPVSNITFTVIDVDGDTTYREAVNSPDGVPATFGSSLVEFTAGGLDWVGADVPASGAPGDGPITSPNYWVTYNFPGPMTTITVNLLRILYATGLFPGGVRLSSIHFEALC